MSYPARAEGFDKYDKDIEKLYILKKSGERENSLCGWRGNVIRNANRNENSQNNKC